MTSYDKNSQELLVVDEICHFDVEKQAEILAQNFASISNEYEELKDGDVILPSVDPSSLPVFTPEQVYPYLEKIKVNKSCILGDIPAKFIKLLSRQIAIPYAHILNIMFIKGEYPNIWKHEIQTPIPKTCPPKILVS